jgi:V8-like Glu-specific endopeptidase
MKLRNRVVVVITCASLAILSQTTTPQAQSAAVTLRASEAIAAMSFWTPERFANATPMDLPIASATSEMVASLSGGTPEFFDGRNGSGGAGMEVQLFDPEAAATAPDDAVQPQTVGTFGAHYTSSRVIPKLAERKYPWKPAGRLFFSTPLGTSWCTASAIGARIIVTAGHCVHNGNGAPSGWYSNWVFIPAYRNGAAPFGSWGWAEVTVTGTWYAGGGGVPNAADYAMILVPDQMVGTKLKRIGEVTGWLGWQTLSLSANHTTQLGYPGNFDSGNIQHQITSGAFRNTAPNNVEYGSDSQGGSSGGPWIQNFSEVAAGQAGIGFNNGPNRVVGVTSYGYISPDPKVQGASIPDSRWSDIFNAFCAANPKNCVQ